MAQRQRQASLGVAGTAARHAGVIGTAAGTRESDGGGQRERRAKERDGGQGERR